MHAKTIVKLILHELNLPNVVLDGRHGRRYHAPGDDRLRNHGTQLVVRSYIVKALTPSELCPSIQGNERPAGISAANLIMEYAEPAGVNEDSDAIIVKADEVDEAGADISTISPTDESESEFNARIETRRAQDAQPHGSPKILANAVPSPPRPATRPILRREGSAPAPPEQPPPPAPAQPQDDLANATDSLSLQQLRRLVTDLPKLEPTAYAYDYSETRSFPEELEEWFSYTEEERYTLLRSKQTFEEKWEQSQAERPASSDHAMGWMDAESEDRESFVEGAVKALENPEIATRVKSLECLSYIALGIWGDTAGANEQNEDFDLAPEDVKWTASQGTKTKVQLKWIANGVNLLCACGALRKLIEVLKNLSDCEQSVSPLFSSVGVPVVQF